MMTEQQTTLKNDVSQNRWKMCISITCQAIEMCKKYADIFKEISDILRVLIRDVATKMAEAFAEFRNLVCNRMDVYLDFDTTLSPKSRNKRPSYKDRVRVNSKGFSKPIICRARSRC